MPYLQPMFGGLELIATPETSKWGIEFRYDVLLNMDTILPTEQQQWDSLAGIQRTLLLQPAAAKSLA